MRQSLPDSAVAAGHADFEILSELAAEIDRRAGGRRKLTEQFPKMLRECIDDVIQSPRTGRRSYAELEKTEKTYIGTRVEIMLRSYLRLPKGKLDLRIGDHDVDVKHTMGGNWMIPNEAVDHACVVVGADEKRALCFLGIVVARPEYLTNSQNRDGKRTLSPDGFRHIHWLIRGVPYPPNFWRTVSGDVTAAIFEGRTGNERVKALFQGVQDRPIDRAVIEAVARQKDFLRRARADKGPGGTRGALATEGIVLLSGGYGATLLKAFGMGQLSKSEFLSHKVRTEEEANLARAAGFAVPWPIN